MIVTHTEYLVHSMDGIQTDRVWFKKLEEALVYGNTMRQAGWHSVLWRRQETTDGDTITEPMECKDIDTAGETERWFEFVEWWNKNHTEPLSEVLIKDIHRAGFRTTGSPIGMTTLSKRDWTKLNKK